MRDFPLKFNRSPSYTYTFVPTSSRWWLIPHIRNCGLHYPLSIRTNQQFSFPVVFTYTRGSFVSSIQELPKSYRVFFSRFALIPSFPKRNNLSSSILEICSFHYLLNRLLFSVFHPILRYPFSLYDTLWISSLLFSEPSFQLTPAFGLLWLQQPSLLHVLQRDSPLLVSHQS